MKTTYDDMTTGIFENEKYSHRVIPSQFGPRSGFDVLEAKGAGDYSKHQDNWKFHLSVSPADTPMAWDIVTNRLMETNYPQVAKVAKPDTAERFANPNSIQAGKQITIYTDKRVSPEKYQELIKTIENDFRQHGINPGPSTNADRSIQGSDYASYRAENGADGQYVASEDLEGFPREQRHNPFNAQDPYANFKIENRSPKLEAKETASSNNMDGVSKGAFGRAVDFAKLTVEKLRDMTSDRPTTVRDSDWQPEKINGQNVAMLETSDMSGREINVLKTELADNGISFNTASNADGSRSSIAVSDPSALNRLQSYVQTGATKSELGLSSPANTALMI
jgi:hypothetical protein